MTGRLLVTTPERPWLRILMRGLTWQAAGSCDLSIRAASAGWSSAICAAARRRVRSAGRGAADDRRNAFAALFRDRHLPIKAALLNQTLLAGVGNIYADESLFQAGIRPRRRTNRLTAAELERLRLALRQVLTPRHPAGRIVGFRLRGCRRGARLFSAGALRLPAHRRALPPAAKRPSGAFAGGARNSLLPQLPAVNRHAESIPRRGIYAFLKNFAPLTSRIQTIVQGCLC